MLVGFPIKQAFSEIGRTPERRAESRNKLWHSRCAALLPPWVVVIQFAPPSWSELSAEPFSVRYPLLSRSLPLSSRRND